MRKEREKAMFREMRRFRQQISQEECVRILEEEPRGVLSVFGEDGYPYGIPINFIYDEGKIYFHCAKTGHKIDALKLNNKVSFCVMDKGFKKERKLGLNIRSVIIFGTVRFVTDRGETREKLTRLGMKYNPVDTVKKEVARDIDIVQILELSIDHMTGKLVNES